MYVYTIHLYGFAIQKDVSLFRNPSSMLFYFIVHRIRRQIDFAGPYVKPSAMALPRG
jgi:hypothetical protein